jgi:hypothetical protein
MEHEKPMHGTPQFPLKYFRNILNKLSNVHNLCEQIMKDGNNKQIIAIILKVSKLILVSY